MYGRDKKGLYVNDIQKEKVQFKCENIEREFRQMGVLSKEEEI